MISTQHMYGDFGGFYIIVRGASNVPLNVVDGVDVPSTARLNLFKTQQWFEPLAWVTLAEVPAGTSGVHFMDTLAVETGNMNFLEGCFHMYSNQYQEFPGTILSTGTEDYFDSAWYFNGGEFHLPVSGYTHQGSTSNGGVTWSAYRFHFMDPLIFTDGFRLVWRNGDAVDASGIKCMVDNGTVVGSPTASNVTAYAWVYTWNS